MLGHLRRRPTQRSSATPISPPGGAGTRRFLCRASSTMARHGVRRRFANSTRPARHKRCRIYVPVCSAIAALPIFLAHLSSEPLKVHLGFGDFGLGFPPCLLCTGFDVVLQDLCGFGADFWVIAQFVGDSND